jgi:hypothetical protein
MGSLKFGTIRAIVAAAAFICIGSLSLPQSAQAVPICIDDLCVEVPTERDMGYEVRSGDFNNDSRTDLYVTGGYFRAVKDFIIAQDAPDPTSGAFNFSIVASPTETQRAAGKSAPLTSINVYRLDLSSDGLNDFQFENVEEVIPNAPNLIILTSKSTGNVPVKVIKEDEKFLDLVEQIEGALQNIDAIMDIYNQIVCVPILAYVQYSYQVWVPTGYFAPYPGGGYYQTYYTWIPVQLGQACWPISSYFGGGPFKDFLDAMSEYKSTLPPGVTMLAPQSVEAAEARVARAMRMRKWARVIRTAATAYRYYRTAAIILGVAMIADDVTVIGVADDPAAVAILASAGQAIIIEATLNATANHLEAKIREDAEAPPAVDPYAIKADCKPWDAVRRAQQETAVIGRAPGTERLPDSARLRANMGKTGCDCPSGGGLNAAHHIIRKDPGKVNDPTVVSAIACLNRNGIDVDEAGNGACLPTRDTRQTSAFKHGEGGMHGARYNQAVLKRCEQAELDGGSDPVQRAQKVRDELDKIRQELATKQQFW